VLIEAVPAGVDIVALARTIAGTRGVASHHDLHVWRISDGFDAATVHVVLQPGHHGVEVAREVASRIEAEHQLTHVTVQPEAPPPEPIVQISRIGSAR
jgi:cobalt-zinc-cadmium efflux system protein